MKVLIVEDQSEKASDILSYLKSITSNEIEVTIEESLRSGLMFLVLNRNTDLVILDMSMPNFTVTENASRSAEPVSFAGRELMKQMKIRDIRIPTAVVTQYSLFEKDNVTLEDLDLEFKTCFNEFYIGSVYYSSASNEWKNDFERIIKGNFK